MVAETLAQAEAARDAVVVHDEPQPAVLDAESALAPEAPLLYPEWEDNVLGRFPFGEGEAEQVMHECPHVLEGELRVGRHQCAPLETRGYVADWRPTEGLHVWASTQNPHHVRSHLAAVLSMPEHRVHVTAPQLGGGFGHKFAGYAEEYLVALLSRQLGRPVKWIETREESLLVGAREFTHRFRAGYDDEGQVLALTDHMIANVGGLATWGGWPMAFPAAMTFPGPYRIRNYTIDATMAVTNKAPWNGYRGYGKEQAAVVLEHIMDRIAGTLGLDPAEVRHRNFIPPESFPHWTAAKHLDSGQYTAALDDALALADYPALRLRQQAAREQGRYLGLGVAFELCPEGGDFAGSLVRGHDTSTVRVHPDGTASVLTGVTSPGTGNETSIALLVARELGIEPEHVELIQGDTDRCPYGFGNFSSRSLATGGAAAVLAARDVRDRLAAAAATLLETKADDLDFVDGVITAPSGASMPLAEVCGTVYRHAWAAPGLEQPLLEATKTDQPHNFHHAPDEQGRFSTYPSYPYSAHVSLIEVDPDTGVITVLGHWTTDDCGIVISPVFVDGQLRGAITQGIGGALWEDLPYHPDDGTPLARTFKHYLTPRAPDLPAIRIAHQETPSPFTLLGTKGAGESGVAGAMAAVLNAVNDALAPFGAVLTTLPAHPPQVLRALNEAQT